LLAGEGNTIQPLADSMQDFATYISDAIYGVAILIDKMKGIPGIDFLSKNQKLIRESLGTTGIVFKALDYFKTLGEQARPTPGMGGYPSSALGPGYIDPNDAARKAAEAAAVKRAKELAALQKKTLDTQKKSLALQKASKTLNIEAINIEAGLKGQISETDRLSLLLQKAILEGNAGLATQLSDQLDSAIKRQNELRQSLLTTPKAPNPYEDWKIPEGLLNYTASSLGVSTSQLQNNPVDISSSFTDAQMELALAYNSAKAAENQITNINVYLDSDLITGAISNVQTNNSLSGSFTDVNRSASRGSVSIR
jgi:hypothetical protein